MEHGARRRGHRCTAFTPRTRFTLRNIRLHGVSAHAVRGAAAAIRAPHLGHDEPATCGHIRLGLHAAQALAAAGHTSPRSASCRCTTLPAQQAGAHGAAGLAPAAPSLCWPLAQRCEMLRALLREEDAPEAACEARLRAHARRRAARAVARLLGPAAARRLPAHRAERGAHPPLCGARAAARGGGGGRAAAARRRLRRRQPRRHGAGAPGPDARAGRRRARRALPRASPSAPTRPTSSARFGTSPSSPRSPSLRQSAATTTTTRRRSLGPSSATLPTAAPAATRRLPAAAAGRRRRPLATKLRDAPPTAPATRPSPATRRRRPSVRSSAPTVVPARSRSSRARRGRAASGRRGARDNYAK